MTKRSHHSFQNPDECQSSSTHAGRRYACPVAMRTWLFCALPLLLSLGCLSTSVRPLSPDGPFHLREGYGYVLLDLDVDRNIETLQLSSVTKVSGLKVDENYYVLELRAGRYSWHRVITENYFKIRYNLSWMRDDERREFEVIEGYVNYPGQLRLRGLASGHLTVSMLNRSAAAAEVLQEQFPQLWSNYPVAYSGYLRDDFLEIYQGLQAGSSEGEPTEPSVAVRGAAP